MLFAFPAAHVGADLSDDLQRGLGADAVGLAQVDAAGQVLQQTAEVEALCVNER